MAKTMFEVKISNVSRNNTQNVTGMYGSFADTVFTGADCPAGRLVVKSGELPMEGYASKGIKNKSAFYMVDATNGNAGGMYGDHTGIYFCANKDVNVVGGYGLGINTLGLTLPAGERGAFCEAIIGETYAVGADDFATLPTDGSLYATISNGRLVATSELPSAGSGVYFELGGTTPVNAGASYWGERYYITAKRTAEAA